MTGNSSAEEAMVITLPQRLEAILVARATERGLTPEALATEVLQRQLEPTALPEPRDEWERRLRSLAINAGVSLSDRDVSSEGIYD
jgi:hypothetical protein